jgi:hypothetical protein
MTFRLNLNINVCLAWLSHNGGLGMTDWAEDAVRRYFSQIDAQRKTDELELIKHHKLVAGAERLWTDLRKFLDRQTKSFNSQTRPDFFSMASSTEQVEVVGPNGSLKLGLDSRVPVLIAQHYEQPDSEPAVFEFKFFHGVNKEGQEFYLFIDQGSIPVGADKLGSQLLDRVLGLK